MRYTYIDECDWPGPEDSGVEAMGLRHQEFIDAICVGTEYDVFKQNVISMVESWKAPDGDAWDIESSKYWIKAWIIQINEYCSRRHIILPDWLTIEIQVVDRYEYPVGYKTAAMDDILVIKCRG